MYGRLDELLPESPRFDSQSRKFFLLKIKSDGGEENFEARNKSKAQK